MKALEPIELDFEAAQVAGTEKFVKHLTAQMRTALRAQGFKEAQFPRCVYVIRLKGSFLVAYPRNSSPVLYIGRGVAQQRITAHLKNWLHHVSNFGIKTAIEIRIVHPKRQNRADFFKYVEAQLIADHADRYGALPLFNSKREWSYEACTFSQDEQKQLSRLIGVGSGNRPWWSIKPEAANDFRDLYLRGAQY